MHKICNELGMHDFFCIEILPMNHCFKFYCSTDITFAHEKWTSKKKCVIDFFNTEYIERLHIKYVRSFIASKIFGFAFIVSGN